MVQVIDELVRPFTVEDVFVFKVYKSPKDGESILGYMEPSLNTITDTQIVGRILPFSLNFH